MMTANNIFKEIPNHFKEEIIEPLLTAKNFKIERIVSRDHCSPKDFWYDQENDEWVLVIKGQATLLFEDQKESVELHEGDYINIPAHRKHRVTWTNPKQETIWLAIHY